MEPRHLHHPGNLVLVVTIFALASSITVWCSPIQSKIGCTTCSCVNPCNQNPPSPPPPVLPPPPPPVLPPPPPANPSQNCPPPPPSPPTLNQGPPSPYFIIVGQPGSLYPLDPDYSGASRKFEVQLLVFLGSGLLGLWAFWRL